MRKFLDIVEQAKLDEMRPDSNEFESLDTEDQWLAKYTYEALDRWPDRHVLDTLVERYPITKPTVIYRGMNFKTKEKYDSFIAAIRNGKLTTNGITSWTVHPNKAEGFAVTAKSYYLDLDTMKADGEAQRQREYIRGYRGLVLKMVVQPGQGIDVNESRLGHESEVIVVPGTYKIEVERDMGRYADAVAAGADLDAAVMQHDSDGRSSYDNDFFHYVMHHHPERLSDAAKHRVFEMLQRPAKVETRLVAKYFDHDEYDKLQIFFAGNFFEAAIKGWFTDADVAVARQCAAKVAKQLTKTIQANPEKIIEIRELSSMAELCGDHGPVRAMKKHIGAQYKTLEAEGREINSLPGDQRDRAIRAHMEKLKKVLNQFNTIRSH